MLNERSKGHVNVPQTRLPLIEVWNIRPIFIPIPIDTLHATEGFDIQATGQRPGGKVNEEGRC